MVASDRRLDNLTVLFDNNRSQTRCLPITRPEEKFASFGFEVLSVDGHDLDALKEAVARGADEGGPRAIVANTIKGKGCATLVRDVFAWHSRSPSDFELETLLGELE